MRFVDSNIFVYHLADDPFYGKRAGDILSTIEKGEKAATSTLVIAQVCIFEVEKAGKSDTDVYRPSPFSSVFE